MKIFIVTCGSYSDYHINRVFSTKEKAKQFIDTKDDDYRIEEFETDEAFEVVRQLWAISLRIKDKKAVRVNLIDDYNKELEGCIEYNDGSYFHHDPTITFYIESDSKQRAIKVASERYGAVIANELAMYPFLRIEVVRSKVFSYERKHFPYYDFNTGAIVLSNDRFESYLMHGIPEAVKVDRREKVVY